MQQIGSQFSQNLRTSLFILFFALLTEFILNFFFKKKKSYHSAVITALSLGLLLRTSFEGYIYFAAIIAIISKRFIKFKDAHIFNPANFAIMFILITLPEKSWVASGVWGKYWLAILLFLGIGMFVTKKARRLDMPFSFLGFYLGMHALRLLWLGDPFELLLFRANSLALIIFSFFMISDPKTTPRNSKARILFSCIVAMIALFYDAVLFERNGLFWALAIASPTTILFNKYLSGEKYQWPSEA